MSAILSMREHAYGVTIDAKVQELARPKNVSLGAVYVTLDRLQDKRIIFIQVAGPEGLFWIVLLRPYREQGALAMPLAFLSQGALVANLGSPAGRGDGSGRNCQSAAHRRDSLALYEERAAPRRRGLKRVPESSILRS